LWLLKIQNRSISRENSLFLEKFSLMRVRKFPVPLPRECGCKPLNWLADWASKSQPRVCFREIPCFFPVSREFAVETGSMLAASTTTQSGANRRFAVSDK
jgi:hypothetical protein